MISFNTKKLRKGAAYRQYLTVIDDINALMEQGYGLTEIHRQLIEESKITMSYQALWDNINRGKKKGRKQVIQSSPTVDSGKSKAVQHDLPLISMANGDKDERRRRFQETAQRKVAEAEKQLNISPDIDLSKQKELEDQLI